MLNVYELQSKQFDNNNNNWTIKMKEAPKAWKQSTRLCDFETNETARRRKELQTNVIVVPDI